MRGDGASTCRCDIMEAAFFSCELPRIADVFLELRCDWHVLVAQSQVDSLVGPMLESIFFQRISRMPTHALSLHAKSHRY